MAKINNNRGIQLTVAAGAVAGAVVVTGILATDELIAVLNLTDGVDLTSEFTVSDDDEIDNTGGTDTDTDILLVAYLRDNG